MSALETDGALVPTFDLTLVGPSATIMDLLREHGIVQRTGFLRKERFVWGAPGTPWPAGSLPLEVGLISVGDLLRRTGSRERTRLWRGEVDVGDVFTAHYLVTDPNHDPDDPRIPEWSRQRGAPFHIEVCLYRVVDGTQA